MQQAMNIAAFMLPLLFHGISPTQVDVSGIDRALLFKELYKHASSKRNSLLNSRHKKINAKAALTYVGKPVEEVNGVTMNVCIPAEGHGVMLDTEKYNEVYGAGAAENAINMARSRSLKLRKKASKQSSGCCSGWKCNRCGCLLACLGAGAGIFAYGVVSGLCCSFYDAGAAVDDFSNFAGGDDGVSNKIVPVTDELNTYNDAGAAIDDFSNFAGGDDGVSSKIVPVTDELNTYNDDGAAIDELSKFAGRDDGVSSKTVLETDKSDKYNDAGPAIGELSKYNDAGPAIGELSKYNDAGPAIGELSKYNDAGPAIGELSKYNDAGADDNVFLHHPSPGI